MIARYHQPTLAFWSNYYYKKFEQLREDKLLKREHIQDTDD